jgi:hypothetical protein
MGTERGFKTTTRMSDEVLSKNEKHLTFCGDVQYSLSVTTTYQS